MKPNEIPARDPPRLRPWRALVPLSMCAAAVLALAAGPGLGLAQERQPQERQPTTRGAGQDRDGGEQRGDRDGRSPWREPSAEEWEAARAFLQEHSPRRLEIYDEAVKQWRAQQDPTAAEGTELPRSIRGARSRIYTRVHFLKQLEDRDEEFYGYALRQFSVEDQIYGHLLDARNAAEAGDEEEAARSRKEAVEAIRRYAEGMLEERGERIRRMREELEREEQRLEQDRSNFDKLVERLMERFERGLPGNDRDRGRDGDGDRDGERDGERPTTRGGSGG